jgi:hypothetical protein
MKIEELVDNMTTYLADGQVASIPQPCSEEQISVTAALFAAEFGHDLPEAYKRVLRKANGVLHNGLTIWPAVPEPLFNETIIQANKDLRASFSDQFVYFGQMDEELYVFNVRTKKYSAIEFVGKPEWMRFASAEEMFEFMLSRAWE